MIAAYCPKQRDDLVPGASDLIGKAAVWERAFLIEDGPYAGEWAWSLVAPRPAPFAWAPESDLWPLDPVIAEDGQVELVKSHRLRRQSA